MKLLRTNTRVNTTDSLGHGMDATFMVVLFFGAGFGLDRLFGTTPIFMIVLTLLGAVGVFATFWYRYEARMQELEARRAGAAGPAAAAPAPDPADGGDAR